MIYKVKLCYKGHSYVDSSFLFSVREEALDFAELAKLTSAPGQLSKVTIEITDEKEGDD